MNKNKEKQIRQICNNLADNYILVDDAVEELKELFGIGVKRYFIFFYQTATFQGSICRVRNEYPSILKELKIIKDYHKEDSIVITNIIEVSKEDYENAIK